MRLRPGGTFPTGFCVTVVVGLGAGDGCGEGLGDVRRDVTFADVDVPLVAMWPEGAMRWPVRGSRSLPGLECECGHGSSGTPGPPSNPTPATMT
ncbi:MAG: hypothetical protein ACM3ML_25675 [Micromonosporaceae bacterium]